jgi:hypothetical protein
LKITGYREGALHAPENEVTIDFPGVLAPEFTRIEIPDVGAWLEQNLRAPGDMLRVQTLQRYGNEDSYVEAYHRGDPFPADDVAGWGQMLDGYALAGQTYRNLHVIDGPLSREMQMQFGWFYRFNADHGMQIRILDGTAPRVAAALRNLGDFWSVEHHHVALCRYDDDAQPGPLVAVEPTGAAAYREIAELGWSVGVDFADWWAQHPEYHRATLRAA